MVKAMDSGIVVSESVFQSRYYVHFRANTLGRGMIPLYPPSNELNSTITVLLGIKHPTTVDMLLNKEIKPNLKIQTQKQIISIKLCWQ